jgi:hypothetical protein
MAPSTTHSVITGHSCARKRENATRNRRRTTPAQRARRIALTRADGNQNLTSFCSSKPEEHRWAKEASRGKCNASRSK